MQNISKEQWLSSLNTPSPTAISDQQRAAKTTSHAISQLKVGKPISAALQTLEAIDGLSSLGTHPRPKANGTWKPSDYVRGQWSPSTDEEKAQLSAWLDEQRAYIHWRAETRRRIKTLFWVHDVFFAAAAEPANEGRAAAVRVFVLEQWRHQLPEALVGETIARESLVDEIATSFGA